ncbi:MAG: hypothetical protein NZ530_01615 [Thermodesulfobacteriaceae bacterium]|nr:hypothetical protein [Thermodesulfobacteriaceae bacterium]MDW8135209.1 hypothetical protein [Thermodesulfobacterium sp.]
MIIKVNKGSFQIIKRPGILRTSFLGSGVALGILDIKNKMAGIFHYIFPYKENDLEIDGNYILSGETGLPLFLEEFQKAGSNLKESKIVIAGASCYKTFPSLLNLAELNLKVALAFLKKEKIEEEKIIKKVKYPFSVSLEINLKSHTIKIEKLEGREEL